MAADNFDIQGKALIFLKSRFVKYRFIDKHVPERVRTISNDNQDWYTEQLKNLDRKRRREFHVNRGSDRYLLLHNEYKIKCKLEKQKFYKNIICKAKEADPNSWYRLLNEDLQIEEISHLSDKEQVETIAQAFNTPSQTYKPLEKSDINLPNFLPDEVPNYSSWEI